uniref:Uncharacterized protein n=1 Tax=Medicago truncatula TaxID=3880 RepID=I3SDW5_MEDTR|nr:unknown [Medicago truncatula]
MLPAKVKVKSMMFHSKMFMCPAMETTLICLFNNSTILASSHFRFVAKFMSLILLPLKRFNQCCYC